MALTNQPYLPLYVGDWMNNNKLKMCSPAAHGIMISVMCIMHKEATYGKLLLKQKYKQNPNQIHNFALQLARMTSFDLVDIEPALKELLDENVLKLNDDFLICQRMVDDVQLSEKRALIGREGGKKTQSIKKNFALANPQAINQANTEYEYIYDYSIEIDSILKQIREVDTVVVEENQKQLFVMMVLKMFEIFKRHNPDYFFHKESDYSACLKIAYHIATMKGWPKESVLNGNMDNCLKSWETIVTYIKSDEKWFSGRSLTDISSVKEWQRLVQQMTKPNASKKQITSEHQSELQKKREAVLKNRQA
jgi:hypothetical protein